MTVRIEIRAAIPDGTYSAVIEESTAEFALNVAHKVRNSMADSFSNDALKETEGKLKVAVGSLCKTRQAVLDGKELPPFPDVLRSELY